MSISQDWQAILAEIRQDKIEEYLTRFIKIKSTMGNETRLSGHLKTKLRKMTPHVRQIEVKGAKPSVIANIGVKNKKSPSIILGGHMDTVPVYRGWKTNPFHATLKNGRLYGVGAYDMKAGLACALVAYEAIAKVQNRLQGNIKFIAVSDEEGWSRGINTLLDEHELIANAAIIGEPTGLHRIYIGRRGRIVFRLEIQTTSTHATSKSVGNNAITLATKVIQNLDQFPVSTNEKYQISGSIVPIGIQGNTRALSTPNSCQVILDYHFLPPETAARATKTLQRYLDKIGVRKFTEIKFITRPTPPPYPYLLKETHLLVKAITKSVTQISQIDPRLTIGRSVADENFLARRGKIPTISYGPSGGNAHGPNEFVEVKDLENISRTYALTILTLLKEWEKKSA